MEEVKRAVSVQLAEDKFERFSIICIKAKKKKSEIINELLNDWMDAKEAEWAQPESIPEQAERFDEQV